MSAYLDLKADEWLQKSPEFSLLHYLDVIFLLPFIHFLLLARVLFDELIEHLAQTI